MIKGIIFDMDGTIVDSLPYHYEAWKIFFNENKVENFSEKLNEYKGGGTLDLMRTVYGNQYSKKELKKMSEDKEKIFRKIYKGEIKQILGFKKYGFFKLGFCVDVWQHSLGMKQNMNQKKYGRPWSAMAGHGMK